jgi:secondary thiamine-phosphate synthase enzyme
MKTHVAEGRTETRCTLDMVDITDEVATALSESSVVDGYVTAFAASPGCALFVNERESGLLQDIRSAMKRLGGDGMDRVAPLMGSSSVVLPALRGKLLLGTWQRVMLVELEGPSERRFVVQTVGE